MVHDPASLQQVLDVPPEFVATHGAASEGVAKAMAQHARQRLGVDYALAVSDVPHDPSTGSFHVAVATPDQVISREMNYAAHPAIQRPLAAKRALNLLRLTLMGQSLD